MSNTLVSTYLSDDRSRASMVYVCESGYKVVCVKTYFGEEKEHYFGNLQQAEMLAEDWVL
jgi:hypothetical protein